MARERKRYAHYQGTGQEHLDPTPIAPPVGYRKSPSLREQIREMVRSERLAQELAATGRETFEESDDFDVGDELEPDSPYEIQFDPPPSAPEPPVAKKLQTTLDRIDTFLRGTAESDKVNTEEKTPAGEKKSADNAPATSPPKGRR